MGRHEPGPPRSPGDDFVITIGLPRWFVVAAVALILNAAATAMLATALIFHILAGLR
jgi:hypothetical protein